MERHCGGFVQGSHLITFCLQNFPQAVVQQLKKMFRDCFNGWDEGRTGLGKWQWEQRDVDGWRFGCGIDYNCLNVEWVERRGGSSLSFDRMLDVGILYWSERYFKELEEPKVERIPELKTKWGSEWSWCTPFLLTSIFQVFQTSPSTLTLSAKLFQIVTLYHLSSSPKLSSPTQKYITSGGSATGQLPFHSQCWKPFPILRSNLNERA